MAANLIAASVIMLLSVSAFFAYFTAENNMEFTQSPFVNLKVDTSFNLNLTDIDRCNEYKNFSTVKEGSWVCIEGIGLTSYSTGNNLIVSDKYDLKMGESVNSSHAKSYNISNPEHKEFWVLIAKEYNWLSVNSLQIEIKSTGFELHHIIYLFGSPLQSNYIYSSCTAGNSSQDTYKFNTFWDMETGIIQVSENISGCQLSGSITKFDFYGNGEMWLSGLFVYGKNLTLSLIESTAHVVKSSSLQTGDWIGFFTDMLNVLGWQTSPDILPYEIQALVIGIPEACLIIGIVSLLYPWGD